jgi:methyl-accepting chemotaxis protein
MTDNYKRRQYVVDAPFQLAFIFKFAAIVIVSSLLIGVMIFAFTQRSTTVAIEKTKVYAKPTSDFILPTLVLTVIGMTTSAGVTVFLMAFFISHRIAGPVYRLKREIDALTKGSLNRNFSIRKHDHLQDLSSSLQDMSDKFYKQHMALKTDYEALSHILRREGISLSKIERVEIEKILDDIQTNIDYYKM